MNTAVLLPASAVAGAAITAAAILGARRRTADPVPGHGGDTAIRATAGLTTIGLAGIAGAISYQHLLILATTHGQHGWLGHAFPLSVDGVEIVASLRLLADRRAGHRPGWMPWGALALGTAFSLFANVAVAEPNLTARVIAGWPAIALMIAIKLLSGLLDQPAATDPAPHHAQQPANLEPEAEPKPEAVPADKAITPATGSGAIRRPARQRARGHGDRQLLPVDLMRRIPVNAHAYQRWQNLWADLRRDGADQETLAQQHQVSVRHLQFVRAAGDAGLLDSPVPPAHRVAELTPGTANGHEPALAVTTAPAPEAPAVLAP